MKRIFIDATDIVPIPTGLGKYSYCMIKAMTENQNIDHHLTIMHLHDLPESHPLFSLDRKRLDFVSIRIPVIGPKRDIGLMKIMRSINKHDILYCLGPYLPAFGVRIPTVVTIHDLKYVFFPEFFSNRLKSLYYNWIIMRSVKMADGVVAISGATKDALLDLGTPEGKITVIHEATTISMSAGNKEHAELPAILHESPFFMFVGYNRPHKNVARMIEAHKRLLSEQGKKCPLFVFAGPNFKDYQSEYRENVEKHKLVFLGAVSDEVLMQLYKQAIALVYPSLYEGFGLPILEAMSMGTPVITSKCSSMPEVAGDAAMLIDPYSVEELFRALLIVSSDETERERLRKAGYIRSGQFSWKRAAAEAISLLNGILEKRSSCSSI